VKILHIITRLIVGGAQENTLLTCEGLHRRGHEVILLTGPSLGAEGSLMQRAQSTGYQVIVTPHLVRSPHPTHDLAAYREIKNLCRTLAPDVVHTHSSKAGILGRAAAWNAGGKSGSPKVIHTIHGLPFHPYQNPFARKLWISLERYAAKRCHAIISVADAMTRQVLAAKVADPQMFTYWAARDIRLGTAANRFKMPELMCTIYSAMEVAPFLHPGTTRGELRQQLHIPPTAFVFGTIARLQPLKGHDDLLATATDLFAQVPHAHLLWIGDGIYRPRFEQLLQEKGWQNRVTLTGLVPPTEVPRLLPAMDALVHPSYREGLARALPQALLAAIPIISYDCDGAAEVCINNQTGYLVKTGDAQALCAAMIKMAADPAQAAAMGATGQTLCLQRFPAEVMVDRIDALYQRLSRPTPHPPA
jgi:glycosyltransferase involved in cell wall biosynthesis